MRLRAVAAEASRHALHAQSATFDQPELSVEPGVARLRHYGENIDAEHVVADLHAFDGDDALESERHAVAMIGREGTRRDQLVDRVDGDAGGRLWRAHARLRDELVAAQLHGPKAAAALEWNDGVAARAVERHALE